MHTRLYNAKICTMADGLAVQDGELWTEDGRVMYVGAGAAAPQRPTFEREVDLGGNLVLPGFKNAHTHSAMTFLRSFADDLPLLDWLEHQVFPMEAKLREEDVYWLVRLAILEYLTSGVTANFDMYMFPEQGARAAVDSGFRTVLCSALNNFTGSIQQAEADYLRFNDYHELVSAQLSFHAEYTCSEELLRGVAALARRHSAPVYTHNSETRREVDGCIARTGQTPTAYMDGLGLFEYGGGGFHCVHVDENDLEIMRKRGLYAVTNPGSNVKLASGTAPLCRMRQLGIPLALGTDGPASNNCLDMFREMFLATGLQKLAQNDAAVMPAGDVLAMACRTGAAAMGLADCDSLAPGKRADLVVIDLAQPNMQPVNHLLHNVVYSGSKSNVALTMVNGKILYENGRFNMGVPAAEIYERANAITAAIKAR